MDYTRRADPTSTYLEPPGYQPPRTLEGLASSTEYPNMNSEQYRLMDAVPEFDRAPYPFYDLLTTNKEGHVIMAANNYTSRVWDGGVYGWESAADIPELGKMCFSQRSEAIVTALRYSKHDDDTFFVGNDRGSVEMWTINRSPRLGHSLYEVDKRHEHIRAVTALDVSQGLDRKVISGSMDGCLKLWEYSEAGLQSMNTLHYAHTGPITGLCTDYAQPGLVVSCSRDASALLWDFRDPKPATVVYVNHDAAFTTIQWGDSANLFIQVAIGDEGGNVYFVDLRQPNVFLEMVECFDRKIRKISFHRTHMAVLGNTPEVKFFDQRCNITYVEYSANNYVRDILWDRMCTDQNICCKLFGWDSYCKTLNEVIVAN